jgi:hypothetical protein
MGDMTRTAFVLTTALSALLLAQSAAAQPRWGRERMPQAGACFFEDANFRGDYFCVRDSDRLLSMPAGMGDRISSVRVLGGSEVTVFRDAGLRGRSARFINDVRDLKREGWNDQISSVDVVRSRGYGGWFPGGNGRGRDNRGADRDDRGTWNSNGRPVWGRNQQLPRAGACFYEDADFRGEYFCVPRGATYTALPRGFNDRISSVRVINAEVRLYQHDDFRGRSREVRSNLRDLRGSWRDTVSSIRVF